MISRGRVIFSTILWKPQVIHSLEYLKYLYTVLIKNQNITEYNKDILIEVFRLIAEILLWGDQHDSSIIDFFLEKNILSLFLKFLYHCNGKMIYKQLLQTLSIMFENISDKTSIYYLLSNNHINAIICHRFDFTDDEVMAYYISFLKALSMKLNKHTINFFFNEHSNDFALLTESLRLFNESEVMVRTAVRNITLNIYKVADKAMLRYITDKTAVPYFHSLMWFVGNRMIEMDVYVDNEDQSLNCHNRLQTIVDEHVDHLHYINDILCLNLDLLNDVLIDSLLNKLYLPLFIYSLSRHRDSDADTHRPLVSHIVSMLMLAQVFFIIKHGNIVQFLAFIILTKDLGNCDTLSEYEINETKFEAPVTNLAQALDGTKDVSQQQTLGDCKVMTADDSTRQLNNHFSKSLICHGNSAPVTPKHRTAWKSLNSNNSDSDTNHNAIMSPLISKVSSSTLILENQSRLKNIFQSLDFEDDKVMNDRETLIALCLLFVICENERVEESLLNSCGLTTRSLTKSDYNRALMDRLINIFNMSVKYGSVIRLVTLELACLLVERLVCSTDQCWISDEHFACILTAYEESKLLLRNYYKSEEIFVNMFDFEYSRIEKRPLNIEFLITDSTVLLPQTSMFVSDFDKKLPTNDFEKARYSIRVFLLLKRLCDKLNMEDDCNDACSDNFMTCYSCSPNTVLDNKVLDYLDLATKDLVSVTIVQSGKSERKFMAIEDLHFVLIEPDPEKVGWGIVTLVGSLQHTQIIASEDDNKSLLINLYNQSGLNLCHLYNSKVLVPSFAAKFFFDDNERCTITRKRLEKGREMAHQLKLQQIALMLDFPSNIALDIKSGPVNNSKEYRSGYFGPKEVILDKNNATSSMEVLNQIQLNNDCNTEVKSNIDMNLSPKSELQIDKTYFQ